MKRPSRALMPVEWIILTCGILILITFSSLGLPLPGEPGPSSNKGPFFFYLKQILVALNLYVVLLVGCMVLRIGRSLHRSEYRLHKSTWRDVGREIEDCVRITRIARDLRFLNVILVMFIEFALLKHLIPHVNSTIYDGWFVESDKLLCGGELCAQALHSLLGISPEIVNTVSQHYFWYYPYMSCVSLLFIMAAPHRLAEEYVTAFVTIFLLGTVVIYLAPTWGPVYYTPELFHFMNGSEMSGLQQELWSWKQQLEQNPSSRSAIFMISGFPSLHVAVILLGSIHLHTFNRFLAALSWFFLLLTIHSTLYLGWHYALDDIGSVGLVLCARAISRRLVSHGKS